jgi:DNA-binding transcriptional LysR family regulator
MRLRSATAAADSLGLSQPAVSQQIAKLEESLGLTLFFRVKSTLQPTAEAEALLDEAERTLQSIERLSHVAEELRQPSLGVLRLAAYTDAAQTILAEAVASFGAQHPAVRFRIGSDNPVRVTEIVATRQADIGISRWAIEQTGCRVERAYSSPLVCLLPANHRLCTKTQITPLDLSNEPLILVCRRPETRMRVAQVFREWGATFYLRAETHTAGTARALVSHGTGILLYEHLFASYVTSDVEIRPFHPELLRPCVVIAPKTSPVSELSRAFILEIDRIALARGANRVVSSDYSPIELSS